jgi:hypothetical protein
MVGSLGVFYAEKSGLKKTAGLAGGFQDLVWFA